MLKSGINGHSLQCKKGDLDNVSFFLFCILLKHSLGSLLRSARRQNIVITCDLRRAESTENCKETWWMDIILKWKSAIILQCVDTKRASVLSTNCPWVPLSAWSRILLEKLTVDQLANKCSESRRFWSLCLESPSLASILCQANSVLLHKIYFNICFSTIYSLYASSFQALKQKRLLHIPHLRYAT